MPLPDFIPQLDHTLGVALSQRSARPAHTDRIWECACVYIAPGRLVQEAVLFQTAAVYITFCLRSPTLDLATSWGSGLDNIRPFICEIRAERPTITRCKPVKTAICRLIYLQITSEDYITAWSTTRRCEAFWRLNTVIVLHKTTAKGKRHLTYQSEAVNWWQSVLTK